MLNLGLAEVSPAMGWRPNETDHDSATIYCLSPNATK